MTTPILERAPTKTPAQRRYEREVRDLLRQLDHLEGQALRRILARVEELRLEVVDRLLALQTTTGPDGAETWQAWQLRGYQQELEAAAGRWSARVQADIAGDLNAAANLGKQQQGALTNLAVAEGVPRAVVSFGPMGLLDNQIAVAVLHSADLIKGVEQSVVTTVNRQVQNVVFGGQSRWDAVEAIRASLATQRSRRDKRLGSLTSQAVRVEQTELMSVFGIANSYSIQNAVEELPQIREEWVAILDSRVDPICAGLGGKRVVPGQPFPGGYSRPPAHPMCRCRTVAWMPGWPPDPFPVGSAH